MATLIEQQNQGQSVEPSSLSSHVIPSIPLQSASSHSCLSSACNPPISLTRNQLLKRHRRELERQKREVALKEALEADPLCRRVSEIHQRLIAQENTCWRWQSVDHTTVKSPRCDETLLEETDSSCHPAKKRKVLSPSPSSSSVDFSIEPIDHSPFPSSLPPSNGILCITSNYCIIDQALQIMSSYTHHSLTDAGEFFHREEENASVARQSCQLFRLDAPYQESPHVHSDASQSHESPSSSSSSNLLPSHGRWSNSSDIDIVHSIDGNNFVFPPRSTAIIGDIQQCGEQLKSSRPPNGFNLIIIDPPWESKSVRRSKRYSCLPNSELFRFPICDLLPSSSSPPSSALVCIWVTNNPLHQQFVLSDLLPRWKLTHVATWHWMKVTDDGRMVLPLHPQAARNFRKPYEVLIIAQSIAYQSDTPRPSPTGSISSHSIASVSSTTSSESQSDLSISQLPSPSMPMPAPAPIPDEFIIFSVPGRKQHSRKPQLNRQKGQRETYRAKGEIRLVFSFNISVDRLLIFRVLDLLRPYLPSNIPFATLELFARNLQPHCVSWGNEPIKYQTRRPINSGTY